jgi:hypothetical protein
MRRDLSQTRAFNESSTLCFDRISAVQGKFARTLSRIRGRAPQAFGFTDSATLKR